MTEGVQVVRYRLAETRIVRQRTGCLAIKAAWHCTPETDSRRRACAFCIGAGDISDGGTSDEESAPNRRHMLTTYALRDAIFGPAA